DRGPKEVDDTCYQHLRNFFLFLILHTGVLTSYGVGDTVADDHSHSHSHSHSHGHSHGHDHCHCHCCDITFCSIPQLHRILLQNQIGDTTMRIIDMVHHRFLCSARCVLCRRRFASFSL